MPLSHWHRSAAPREGAHADAVVIGSGICGVGAALAMQRRGLTVRVLERHALAAGASSRNAGFLMRGAADNYGAAAQRHGRPIARLLWKWTEDNLADLRAEGIRDLPSYRDVPSCLLALEPGELAELQQSLAMLREDGFAAEWIDRGKGGGDSAWNSRVLPPLGGLVNPGDAAVNPVELMRFLAGKLQTPVSEGSEVGELRAGTGSSATGKSAGVVEVVTPHAVIRTPRVLVCTNAYAGTLLPSLAGLIAPRRGQMLALKQDGIHLDACYYVNHGYEYLRQTADGAIVVGGCRGRFADTEVGCDDQPTPEVQDAIEAFGAAMLGLERVALNVTARWAGTMGFTPDGLPLIGPVAGDWPEGTVWFCGAFNGQGMSMAWRTAHAAVAAMLDGAANPFPLARLHEGEKSRAGAPAR